MTMRLRARKRLMELVAEDDVVGFDDADEDLIRDVPELGARNWKSWTWTSTSTASWKASRKTSPGRTTRCGCT